MVAEVAGLVQAHLNLTLRLAEVAVVAVTVAVAKLEEQVIHRQLHLVKGIPVEVIKHLLLTQQEGAAVQVLWDLTDLAHKVETAAQEQLIL